MPLIINVTDNYMRLSSFSCKLNTVIPEEKDSILALASIEQLKPFIPEIDAKANFDLLPISFDACVVNKFNKNDDGIDTAIAIAIAKNFIFKPINVEHKRTNIGGVILSASFTSIDNHKVLSEADIKDSTEPFYITLGGVMWRSIKPELAEHLEECSDPSSPDYESVSASWELAFESYKIALRDDNSRLVKGSQIIDDEVEIEKIEKSLISSGGNGRYNGKKVYRLLNAGVTPVGIGLTENPAAEVKGVACNTETKEEENKEVEASKTDKNENLIKNSSQIKNVNVTSNEEVKIMELKNLDQIVDESLKDGTINASSLKDFYVKKIEEAGVLADKAKADAEKLQKDAEAANQKLASEHEELVKSSKEMAEKLKKLEDSIAEELKQKNFNVRMEYFDTNFELTPENKKVLAQELNSIASDDDFKAYIEKMKSFLVKKEDKSAVVVASTPEDKNLETVVDKAIGNGTPATATVPNTTVPSEDSYINKYAKAFSKDSFNIQVGRNTRKK